MGRRGSNPALWWVNDQGEEVKWTFGDVTDLTCRTANVLTHACDLQQGDRLILILPRIPEWWLVSLGCIRAGIIFVPGTTQMKVKDFVYRQNLSKAKGVITTDTLAPEVDSMASECPALKTKILVSDHSRKGWLDFRSLIKAASPDHTCVKSKTNDPMVIFFTSGTTGLPKMAKHSHELALRSSLPSCSRVMQMKTNDIFWCLSDPGWVTALVCSMFHPWTVGSTVFSHDLTQFDPKLIVQIMFEYPVTQCFAVPTVFRMLLQQDSASLRFPNLECCWTGGEALLLEDQQKWTQRTGVPLIELYGQTETGMATGTSKGMKIKPGSLGKAIPPFDIKVIDEKGHVLPPNTEGSIGIRIKPTRPTGLFMCYEDDPVKTAKMECGDFYNTGDKGIIDEEGYIWLLGRDDDVINASGYRIGPTEVENALAQHPAVAESAVVSSPDPVRGQVVKAFIVLTPQFLSQDLEQLAKELQQYVKSVTAPYKYPRKVEFVLELPKTVTGKIKRHELREKEFGEV
ncbi:PREDICTED: acyl-coenzyme A synthetase ACSM1, mitochondrial isoform X2 [Hipposideros armiger]|nr:PREDICTED: acyl-coenzyme A synthetase ACSM1, mitochondrial isoform X2 [Hipposideros armiger]